jgi:hypothetical protein
LATTTSGIFARGFRAAPFARAARGSLYSSDIGIVVAGYGNRRDARPQRAGETDKAGLIAADRQHLGGAHGDRQHHSRRAEISGRAIDDNDLAGLDSASEQAAIGHHKLGECDQPLGWNMIERPQCRRTGSGPMCHLGEDAVTPDLLQLARSLGNPAEAGSPCRGQADEDLRWPYLET